MNFTFNFNFAAPLLSIYLNTSNRREDSFDDSDISPGNSRNSEHPQSTRVRSNPQRQQGLVINSTASTTFQGLSPKLRSSHNHLFQNMNMEPSRTVPGTIPTEEFERHLLMVNRPNEETVDNTLSGRSHNSGAMLAANFLPEEHLRLLREIKDMYRKNDPDVWRLLETLSDENQDELLINVLSFFDESGELESLTAIRERAMPHTDVVRSRVKRNASPETVRLIRNLPENEFNRRVLVDMGLLNDSDLLRGRVADAALNNNSGAQSVSIPRGLSTEDLKRWRRTITPASGTQRNRSISASAGRLRTFNVPQATENITNYSSVAFNTVPPASSTDIYNDQLYKLFNDMYQEELRTLSRPGSRQNSSKPLNSTKLPSSPANFVNSAENRAHARVVAKVEKKIRRLFTED